MASMTSPAGTSVHLVDDLRRCVERYTGAKAGIQDLVAGLTDAQFNERPQPNYWSVAECLDHLVVIGSQTVPKLRDGIRRAEEKGWRKPGPYRYGWVGNYFVKLTGPTDDARKRKFKAPKQYTPSSNHSISRIVKAFSGLQDELIETAVLANGVDLGRVKVPSPVTNLLKLSLGQWLTLLAGHQERHFLQAKDVRAAIEGGASPQS